MKSYIMSPEMAKVWDKRKQLKSSMEYLRYFDDKLGAKLNQDDRVRTALFCTDIVINSPSPAYRFFKDVKSTALRFMKLAKSRLLTGKPKKKFPDYRGLFSGDIQRIVYFLATITEYSSHVQSFDQFLDHYFKYTFKEHRYLAISYIDVLLNKTRYITPDDTIFNFAAQDIDTLTQLDIDMILDYIKEEFDLDLTELSVHPRILAEFIRCQMKIN